MSTAHSKYTESLSTCSIPIKITQMNEDYDGMRNISSPVLSENTSKKKRDEQINEYIKTLGEKFGIDRKMLSELNCLKDYRIVLLCDDSGSMQTTVDGTQLTRWDELRALVRIIVLISVIFDQNGVDIYFLNRVPLLRVTNPDVIEEVFDVPPRGYSNLAGILDHIFSLDMSKPRKDKKMLVFVATDAEPTNEEDQRDLSSLEDVMRTKRCVETTHVMFLLCNDSSECVKYLSKWDREMENVDLLDDYETEKAKVLKQIGNGTKFSYSEYLLKAMLGALDVKWDQLGEVDSD